MDNSESLYQLAEGLEIMETCVSCLRKVRRGKLLRCFHAVCESCVSEHTHGDGTRLCPRCEKVTERQAGSQLPSVPDDFLSGSTKKEDRQAMASPAAADSVLCDECTSDTPATHRCTDCEFQLCTGHAVDHSKRRAFSGHRVVAAETISRTTGGEDGIKCPFHPSIAMTMYCEPCQCLVCDKCLATGGHHGDEHQVWKAEDAAPIAIARLASSLQIADHGKQSTGQISGASRTSKRSSSSSVSSSSSSSSSGTSAVEELTSMAKRVEEMIAFADEDHQAASVQIHLEFDRLRGFLRVQEEQRQQEVDRIVWSQLKELERQREAARQASAECQRAISLLTYFSLTEQVAHFLHLSAWLSHSAERLAAVSRQTPCLLPKVQFDRSSFPSLHLQTMALGSVHNSAILVSTVRATARPFLLPVAAANPSASPAAGIQIDVAAGDGGGMVIGTAGGAIRQGARWKVSLKLPGGLSYSADVQPGLYDNDDEDSGDVDIPETKKDNDLPLSTTATTTDNNSSSSSTSRSGSGAAAGSDSPVKEGAVAGFVRSLDGLMARLQTGSRAAETERTSKSTSSRSEAAKCLTVNKHSSPRAPMPNTSFTLLLIVKDRHHGNIEVSMSLNGQPVPVKPAAVVVTTELVAEVTPSVTSHSQPSMASQPGAVPVKPAGVVLTAKPIVSADPFVTSSNRPSMASLPGVPAAVAVTPKPLPWVTQPGTSHQHWDGTAPRRFTRAVPRKK